MIPGEVGPQRRVARNGCLLHCCSVCLSVGLWEESWSCYCSIKDLDDEAPIAKFCSVKCREKAGPVCENITDEMKSASKAKEWRDPRRVYRKRRYVDALWEQKRD